MATCHDPYRELEIYLEQAEEEIGKAFEELLEFEANVREPSSSKWSNGETVLPPPPAFSSTASHILCCDNELQKPKTSATFSHSPGNVMNRVCHDGNVLDMQRTSNANFRTNRPRPVLQKSLSCLDADSYFSKIGSNVCDVGASTRCHNTSVFPLESKQLQKQLRTSLSFPEGAMDSVIRENGIDRTLSKTYSTSTCPLLRRRKFEASNSRVPNTAPDKLFSKCGPESLPSRQRSVSVTSSSPYHSDEHFFPYPRPPSGDVNSLSVWADNLVIAIDQTLTNEFEGSTSGSSPLSEFELSPSKHEDENDSKTGMVENMTAVPRPTSFKFYTEANGTNLKNVSASPDSGIVHVCDTPDVHEDVIDASFANYRGVHRNKELELENRAFENFDDLIKYRSLLHTDIGDANRNRDLVDLLGNGTSRKLESREEVKNPEKLGKRDAETQVCRQVLRAANSVTFTPDGMLLGIDSRVKELHRHARVVPIVSMDLEDCATVTTTACVSEAPWKGTVFSGVETKDHVPNSESLPIAQENGVQSESKSSSSTKSSSEVFFSASDFGSDNAVQFSATSMNECLENATTISCSTLPKHVNRMKEQEHFCSLPRDTGRNNQDGVHDPILRSSSSSAVSSLSQVSMDELADFMRKVKRSTYHPPPRADVSVDVKNDNDDVFEDDSNRDAVTQTTPVVPLSRSSSFTWVTECDCSDWDSSNAQSGSEGSLLVFSHSNSASENKTAPSSSSLSLSTDEDGFEAPQNSYCSSLYLSACSDASDSRLSESSSDDTGKQPKIGCNLQAADSASLPKTETSTANHSVKSLSSVGTLVDIAEESPLNETVSLLSAASSQSESPATEQPASFPSTLKSYAKSRFTDEGARPTQPIEANVLIVNELNVKSVSAPVLRQKRHPAQKADVSSSSESSPPSAERTKEKFSKLKPTSPSKAHAKDIDELQAIEACSWLRATGFPQYAQMYDDNLFPVDVSLVQRDHTFLHPDSMQSLFRRLNTLNRCARMKFDNMPKASLQLDESDDEEQCALSEHWEFQRISRRWSRVPSPTPSYSECSASFQNPSSSPKVSPHSTPSRKFLTPEEAYCSSHDSVFGDETHSSPDSIRRCAMRKDEHCLPVHYLREGGYSPGSSSGSGGTLSVDPEDPMDKAWDTQQRELHRSGSDRIREGAKALLRRMESLKGRKKKKANDARKLQNSPNISAGANSGTDGSSCSSLTSSPLVNRHFQMRITSPHDSYDCIQGGTPQLKPKKRGFGLLYKGEKDAGAHSDSECPVVLVSEPWKDDDEGNQVDDEPTTSQSSDRKELAPSAHKDGSKYLSVKNLPPDLQTHGGDPVTSHQRGHNVYSRCPHLLDEAKLSNRASHYDNYPAPLVAFNNACVENLEKDQGSPGKCGGSKDQLEQNNGEGEIIIINNRRDSGVGASLTRASTISPAPWHSFPVRPPDRRATDRLIPISELTAPQMLILRKLSLLKLTTLMEKFSPSSRTGWSWAMPKFIRRIRTPDYKDKLVFGVPLLLVLQRTGEPLPASIQAAIHHLRKTALDSTGLFRKSGVRSRIQKLRALSETNSDKVDFEDQQAYDVADMLKQYFRELPEVIFTNKLSETFIAIFQYIPEELRLEAIQAAVLLMPDENREVLHTLLSFLREVCQHSGENQMTATNIAVCFAPSLFQLSSSRSSSSSPRRRKTVGAPDLKELSENRAAYECLSSMVTNLDQLNIISENVFLQSRIPCMDSYEPAFLGELGNLVCKEAYGWKTYVECCVQAILKDAKEKYRGWETVSQTAGVELAYRKVGDGYPLRLWKVSTEVEAPPTELLNRILRERHIWDSSFIKWRVVQTLEKQAEVFQFTCSSLPPHPPCDYCIIRAWKTDLPKGACVLIEASIEHSDAKLLIDSGVRALILASRFLIEPCGSGKSRITHFCRIDTRGRSPDWYNRAYGFICTLNLIKLRDSFSHIRAGGPETKV